MLDDETLARLREKAREIRASIVGMVTGAQSGHVGGSLSATDLVVALHYRITVVMSPESSTSP
ncbi:MAG: 1-deoxy-D-xylulose-5-phosphate synthase N-terminal domain-containing protein [Bryobacteraceae bacterium]